MGVKLRCVGTLPVRAVKGLLLASVLAAILCVRLLVRLGGSLGVAV